MEHISEIKNIIHTNRYEIARRIVDKQYRAYPDKWESYGEAGKQKSIRDAEYHLPFLTEAIVSENEEVFTDYIEWTHKLFQNLRLPDDTLNEFLEISKEVLQDYLDNEMKATVNHYIDKGLETLKTSPLEESSWLDHDNPYGSLTKAFNEALLRGDRQTAHKLIMDAVESGVKVKDIYLHVFQPSQYEIGRLWLNNQISVAKEHFASAATQQIMAQLYPYIFSSRKIGKSMVAATVGGELHEIGIRMVADFFEMEGWDTYYLGANTPAESIVQAAKEYKADLVALSAAMPFHRSKLKEIIKEIRQQIGDSSLKIMIGGNAIKNNTTDWQWFGADAYASDAQKAIKRALEIVK
ncbi:MAG: cobalamin-dependent protein [Bacteroidales bacterium]|nr:cobalamin-dependent protein [Bacteroidales bacterium]